MYGLMIERHALDSRPLSRKLVELLLDRVSRGKVVIVTQRPNALHAATKKRWLYTLRRLAVDRSRTLDPVKRQDIDNTLKYNQNIRFSSKMPSDYLLKAHVTFMSATDCARIAPECQTLCVVGDASREKLYLMTAWIPSGGRVIFYG